MESKKSKSYYLPKSKDHKTITIKSCFLQGKSSGQQKVVKQREKSQNRSTSFQTVKKLNLSNVRKQSPFPSRINSQRNNLNSTLKKKQKENIKLVQKSEKKVFLDDRSDFQPQNRHFSTPRFGQQRLQAQNLTSNRLDMLFELQTIKREFHHNLKEISLNCFQRLSPLQKNLRKFLETNENLLEKEWFLIQKSCLTVKNQKDNEIIEKMICQWDRKRKRIQDLEKNLQKAFQLLLL